MKFALPEFASSAEAARIALRYGEQEMSYAQLEEWVRPLASALETLPPGTGVGIRCGHQPAFLVAVLACLRSRRPAILLDAAWRGEELEAASSACPIGLLLQTEDAPDRSPLREHLVAPEGVLAATGALLSWPEEAPHNGTAMAADTALVHWTSGSTGRPKPLAVSRSALDRRAAIRQATFPFTSATKTLCALPLSHCHGIEYLGLATLWAGGELTLLEPHRASAAEVVETIRAHGITFFSALPRFYEELLELEPPVEHLRSVEMPMCGSAALSPEVAASFDRRFGVRIGQGYGLTEVGMIALNQHRHGAVRHGSVGPVLEGIEWRVNAPDDQGVGELWVRSEACVATAPDGWLHTGDLVRADPDGYLWILGRIAEFANVGGMKVDPREVQDVIDTLPWVAGEFRESQRPR